MFFGEGEGPFYCGFCKFQHRRDASTSRVSAIEKESILAKCIAGFVERGAGGRAVRAEVFALAGLAATLSDVLDATNDDRGLIFGSHGEILEAARGKGAGVCRCISAGDGNGFSVIMLLGILPLLVLV